MTVVQAIILGIVQGLTEFLPISSIAHLRVIPALLGWPDPGAAFSAVIQLGTLVAVLVYFGRDLGVMTRAVLEGIFDGRPWRKQEARLAWFIVLGTL
ncbi:MAG: undecaprenyl-diphosphate phosphatase, partial [Candidatus Methylomirabilota bacterium]